MELVAEIRVLGDAKPEPQGSAEAFVPLHPRTKQPYRRPGGGIMVNVTSDNKQLKAWRKLIADACRVQNELGEPVEVGVTVEVVSFVKRPEGHWGTGRNAKLLKDHAPAYPLTRPDVDKLLRAVLDALTEVVWKDDSVVTDAITRKRYAVPRGESPMLGAIVRVWLNDVTHACQLDFEERVRDIATAPSRDDEQTLALAM